jgi:glycerol kinase
MDTYLLYRLTRGRCYATEYTNASRTLLYDITWLCWDEDLCRLFGVLIGALPQVLESQAIFGQTDPEGLLDQPLPICGVMGDSQAAVFAERCFQPGSTGTRPRGQPSSASRRTPTGTM